MPSVFVNAPASVGSGARDAQPPSTSTAVTTDIQAFKPKRAPALARKARAAIECMVTFYLRFTLASTRRDRPAAG